MDVVMDIREAQKQVLEEIARLRRQRDAERAVAEENRKRAEENTKLPKCTLTVTIEKDDD
jgi:DNA-binding protein H-NS